jgi:hypothetical protein
MISMQECAEFAGMALDNVIFDVPVSRRHAESLASYLFNIHRGAESVRQMIIADLLGFLDLGLRAKASDALVVLRMFLSDYPDARRLPIAA